MPMARRPAPRRTVPLSRAMRVDKEKVGFSARSSRRAGPPSYFRLKGRLLGSRSGASSRGQALGAYPSRRPPAPFRCPDGLELGQRRLEQLRGARREEAAGGAGAERRRTVLPGALALPTCP